MLRGRRTLGLALGLLGVLAPGIASAGDGLDVEGWLRRPGVKLVAVEFYATWCKPCMAAVPKWKALHEKYAKDGLRLIVVATQDADGACANPGWAPDKVICDDDGFLAERFGAQSLPAAYLWGWQGHLLAKKAHVEDVEAQIERWMRRTPRVDVDVDRVAKGAGISKRDLRATLRAELKGSDKLTVVATEAERKKLRAIARRSMSSGFADDKLACEVGQEVSANSLLEATITGGRKKRLQLKLLSAERGCLVASATTRWYPNKRTVSIREAISELGGRLRLDRTQYPWAGGGAISRDLTGGQSRDLRAQEDTSYEALARRAAEAKAKLEEAEKKQREERAAYQAKLEKAWASVKGFVETKALPKRDRLGALSKFLRDFPSDNPHEQTAKGYAKLLEAGKEPNAAPEGMVSVPAGEFYMGCNERVDSECDSDEKPGKTVYVGAFRIDETEVTVAAYRKCVAAGACSAPNSDLDTCNWGKSSRGDHPVNCLDWAQATAYCRWAGKRLPTEKEWEKAARGTDGRKYAWGNAGFGSTKVANIADETAKRREPSWTIAEGYDDGYYGTAPVGSYPAGDSPYGAKDMIGNVWEWVSDWYSQNKTRSVRGGSWGNLPKFARASNRNYLDPAKRLNFIGFRCAQSP